MFITWTILALWRELYCKSLNNHNQLFVLWLRMSIKRLFRKRRSARFSMVICINSNQVFTASYDFCLGLHYVLLRVSRAVEISTPSILIGNYKRLLSSSQSNDRYCFLIWMEKSATVAVLWSDRSQSRQTRQPSIHTWCLSWQARFIKNALLGQHLRLQSRLGKSGRCPLTASKLFWLIKHHHE